MMILLFVAWLLLANIVSIQGYYYMTENLPWKEAELYCQDICSSNLASVHSLDDANAVKQKCIDSGFENSICWIGLHSPTDYTAGNEGTFEWSDGTAVNYTNWELNEPSGGNYNYNVTVVYARDGFWSAWRSNMYHQHFICNDCLPLGTNAPIVHVNTTAALIDLECNYVNAFDGNILLPMNSCYGGWNTVFGAGSAYYYCNGDIAYYDAYSTGDCTGNYTSHISTDDYQCSSVDCDNTVTYRTNIFNTSDCSNSPKSIFFQTSFTDYCDDTVTISCTNNEFRYNDYEDNACSDSSVYSAYNSSVCTAFGTMYATVEVLECGGSSYYFHGKICEKLFMFLGGVIFLMQFN
jgi:hypothetical protein